MWSQVSGLLFSCQRRLFGSLRGCFSQSPWWGFTCRGNRYSSCSRDILRIKDSMTIQQNNIHPLQSCIYQVNSGCPVLYFLFRCDADISAFNISRYRSQWDIRTLRMIHTFTPHFAVWNQCGKGCFKWYWIIFTCPCRAESLEQNGLLIIWDVYICHTIFFFFLANFGAYQYWIGKGQMSTTFLHIREVQDSIEYIIVLLHNIQCIQNFSERRSILFADFALVKSLCREKEWGQVGHSE